MRNSSKIRHSGLHGRRLDSGAALVIVLGLLVIILGLAITFLSRTVVERSASAGYAASATTRTLSDSAVNLIQAQIRDATTQGGTVAWASQPGMIRTFSDAAGGPLLRAYKLYSADKLILDKPTTNELSADLPPTSWASDKAIWSDLNSPVTVNGIPNYPILDPGPLNNPQVEGFSISDAPTTGTTNPAPMPVRWLYVLQSGVIVSPVGGSDSVTIPGADKDPIVGRIAFWTDDETSKVNINTASEGTFWDTPRVNSVEDRKLAESQPAQKEFQRYPGHPATTSLAPVLLAKDGVTPDVLSKPERDALYLLSPRIVGGGSDGGSLVYTSAAPLALDRDRLYASVDEVIYNAERGDQDGSLNLDRTKLERAKFFLSATSRAPEVTLFNTPRVAVWPIDKDTSDANRSPFDRLIAFCSTIDGDPYYFTREDPKSPVEDFSGSVRNQQLYKYLQGLSSRSVPGFGGNFLSKYPSTPNGSDRDQILTEMFDYIRITNLNDPQVSNNFYKRGKFGDGLMGNGQVTPIRIGQTQGFGRFPMVTEVGIQFICTADPGTDPATQPNGLAGSNVAGNLTLASHDGVPVLLQMGERRIEAMLLFETFVPSMGWPPIAPSFTMRVKGLETIKVENATSGTLVPFPASRFPAQGVVGSGRNTAAGNIFGGMSYGGSVSPRWMYAQTLSPARLDGKIPQDVWSASMPNLFADPYPTYPFISDPITIKTKSAPPASSPLDMTVSSGTITVEIYAGQGNSVAGMPVYTMELKFDPTTMPIPTLVEADMVLKDTASSDVPVPKESFWTFSAGGAFGDNKLGRLSRSASTAGQPTQMGLAAPFIPNHDVLRTLVPKHSDFRLLGGENSTATTEFVGIKPENPGDLLAHSMGEGGRNGVFFGYIYSARAAGLAKDVLYSIWNNPDVSYASPASEMGDWDNGVALGTDGPFINKPDEGNKSKPGLGNIPYYGNEEVYEEAGTGQFSPNRQIPSAGMFGSLPTGMKSGKPYQTLLFRPQPTHPQSAQSRPGQPADHLWTDLFWMPVVEPYAISEPFSTAGKINMNYEIKPFSYIKRATGLYALMRSERLLAIPAAAGENYKAWGTVLNDTRWPIDIAQTLFQFESKFKNDGDVFRSASQICDIYLIPRGQSWISSASYSQANLDSDAVTYWKTNSLTGDNSRERPYTNLLGRLTTKSNTYTVHCRVQALKQSPTSTVGTWNESKDKVLGEYRGSTTIERYINPNDAIPDYASASDPASLPDLGGFYKWRVLSSKQFAP